LKCPANANVTIKRLDLFLISLCATPIELGWSVGECLIVGYFLSIGLPPIIISIQWVPSPILGFFLHPLVGAWSDRCHKSNKCCGGRLPFILVLTFGSILGLVSLPFSEEIVQFLYGDKPKWLLSVWCIALFGLLDTCHDLLLGPTRSIINDVVSKNDMERANSWMNAASILGRMLGYGIAALNWHEILRDWNLPYALKFTSMQIAFILSSFLIFLCILISSCTYLRIREIPNYAELLTVNDEDSIEEGDISFTQFLSSAPSELIYAWFLYFVNWIILCIHAFFFTVYFAQDIQNEIPGTKAYHHSISLAASAFFCQTFIALIWNLLLEKRINKIFSPLFVLIMGSIWISIISILLFFVTQEREAYALAVMYGLGYQINFSYVYYVTETYLREESDEFRGVMNGIVNEALSLSQIVVGASTGVVVHFTKSFRYPYLISGCISLLVCFGILFSYDKSHMKE